MALSQIQCLDDNHVNPRTHESKPEFLYCEDQRLALEVLLQDGREAYFKCLEARGLRGFLSDLEMETLTDTVEPYDPESEIFPEDAEEDEPPLSLHYWPELSDTSIPQMDLGWPDTEAYRGVTRTTIYSQPPLDGQTHIKEIVRKMIAQAQKVIAVVMDIFTDVDIFRDLLDAGFKRRISVYILLEHTTLPHFLSMCQRANMHAGHLKNLRVRCTGGAEFYSRASTRVRGRMGHRFMFIDGDKAVSGSYSFTWMSSRLDTNHITVVTGQAVDAFDRLFRTLYVTSKSVDLRQVATEPEPAPEPLPQIATVAPPIAALARKLYNPKYALVLGNQSSSPSPTPSPGHTSPKQTESPKNSRNPEVPDAKKRRRRRPSKEAIPEAPPIHPGLTNLEKACLMSYLPTWPEPDPPSDVIGFINVRDASKQNQVHLQRSEMFETSQAIRFSSPFSKAEETLPELAKPRQLTSNYELMRKLQSAQDKTKAEEALENRSQPSQRNARPSEAKAPEQNSRVFEPKSESNKDTFKSPNTEDKLHSNTSTNITPCINAHALPQSSKVSTPNTGRPSHAKQALSTNNPQSNSLPQLNTQRQAGTSLNTPSAVVYWTHNLPLNSTQSSHLHGPNDSNPRQHVETETVLPYTAVKKQPQNSKVTPCIHTPSVNSMSPSSTSAMCSQSVNSTSHSANNHVSNTTSMTISADAPLSSINSSSSLPPPTSSSTTLLPSLPSSSASPSLTSAPPIPKPRTIQLVTKESVNNCVPKLPESSLIRRPETISGLIVVRSDSAVETVVRTPPVKDPKTRSELLTTKKSKTGTEKDAEGTANIGKAEHEKNTGTFQDTKKNEEAKGLQDDRKGMQFVAGTKPDAHSGVLITNAPKAESVSFQDMIPKDVEPKTLTSVDVATMQAGTKAPEKTLTGCEFTEAPNENSNNVTQSKTNCTSAYELQRTSYNTLIPQDVGVVDTVDSSKAQTHNPSAGTHNPHVSKAGDSTHAPAVDANVQQGSLSSNHKTFQEITSTARGGTHTPERPLRLHLCETHKADLRSPTPERESRLHRALVRTPTPDGYLPHTPDSQTNTQESRSYTPDFRTPTPDVSDGYVSPRPESALSTTSEEYYECSDSPLQESVSDRTTYRKDRTEVPLTHTNTPVITTAATSPAHVNHGTCAAMLGTTDTNTSSSGTLSLCGPASTLSSSSVLEKQVKMREEEKSEKEVDEKRRKLSVAERRTEGDSRDTQKRGREEAKKTEGDLKQRKDLTETAEKNKEAEPQSPKKKRVLNQTAAERLVDRGVTPGELPNEGAERRRSFTGDLRPKRVSSDGERSDKEKTGDRAALGPSSAERRGRAQSTREAERQSLLHSPTKPSRGQLQDSGVSFPSRPSKSPRSLSANPPLGPRPWGSRQLSQAESKAVVSTSKVMGNTSSPRRLPSRPLPPVAGGAVGSTAGQKQAEVSHSQQSHPSQQPPQAQGRARAGQSPNRRPKPQASFLHSQSNALPQLHPQSQNQTVSAQETQSQEEGKGPFSFTISRLYNLKGLKDKMSKLPSQSRRGSTSSPVQGRKGTS